MWATVGCVICTPVLIWPPYIETRISAAGAFLAGDLKAGAGGLLDRQAEVQAWIVEPVLYDAGDIEGDIVLLLGGDYRTGRRW